MPNTYEDQPGDGRSPDARRSAAMEREYTRRIDCAESGRSRPDAAYGAGRGAPDSGPRAQLRRAG